MVLRFMGKKDFLFTCLKIILQIFVYVSYWLCFILCFTSFPLSVTFLFNTVFEAISSNIDEVLSINPSANVFVFGDFHWFTCTLYHPNLSRGECRLNDTRGYKGTVQFIDKLHQQSRNLSLRPIGVTISPKQQTLWHCSISPSNI